MRVITRGSSETLLVVEGMIERAEDMSMSASAQFDKRYSPTSCDKNS